LNTTFGALLIGIVVSAALYGVTCTQVFFYFQNYNSSDGIVIKGTVILLLILESLHSAFSIHAIYYYTITNYFNPSALALATWSSALTIGVSGGIILVVHLFYARRVYYMSRKNVPLVGVILLLALAHFGVNTTITARALKLKFFTKLSSKSFAHVVIASISLALSADFMIAASLSFYLHTGRSGIESTDTLINKLMAYVINNVILTSVFDIIDLIFVITEIDNLIFLAIFQIVGNLYTNSMLATLNSRQSLHQASHAKVTGPSQQLTTFRSTTLHNDSTIYSADSKVIRISSAQEADDV